MNVVLSILSKTGWEIRKSGLDRQHLHTYLLFCEKNRDNRSSSSWDTFAQLKKRKKLTEAKYIALSASLLN